MHSKKKEMEVSLRKIEDSRTARSKRTKTKSNKMIHQELKTKGRYGRAKGRAKERPRLEMVGSSGLYSELAPVTSETHC